jgi:three-Cys-motif partner protein
LEPHTAAKHKILRNYLDAWFPILAMGNGRIVYLDGFSGPGQYSSGEPGSPIIALKSALAHGDRLKGELVFFFIEEDKARAKHLDGEVKKLNLPSNFVISIEVGEFAKSFGKTLDAIEKGGLKLAPTFALIDPFGFSGLPYALIKRLLSHAKCEVLITFMADSINRWLEHPDDNIKSHIVETFGTEQAVTVAQGLGDRIPALRNLYFEQLRKVARFVRYFEMRKRDHRVVYYLFFASNNTLGHIRMKEAMWRVDPFGDFTFSDSTDPQQHVLFEVAPAADVADKIVARFKGNTKVFVSQVEAYVQDDTAYLRKHMGEALKQLEAKGALTASPIKSDGSKRRAGTFPNKVVLSFK